MRIGFWIKSLFFCAPLAFLFWLPTHSGCGFLFRATHYVAPKTFNYTDYEGSLYGVLTVKTLHVQLDALDVQAGHMVLQWTIRDFFRHGVFNLSVLKMHDVVLTPLAHAAGPKATTKPFVLALPFWLRGLVLQDVSLDKMRVLYTEDKHLGFVRIKGHLLWTHTHPFSGALSGHLEGAPVSGKLLWTSPHDATLSIAGKKNRLALEAKQRQGEWVVGIKPGSTVYDAVLEGRITGRAAEGWHWDVNVRKQNLVYFLPDVVTSLHYRLKGFYRDAQHMRFDLLDVGGRWRHNVLSYHASFARSGDAYTTEGKGDLAGAHALWDLRKTSGFWSGHGEVDIPDLSIFSPHLDGMVHLSLAKDTHDAASLNLKTHLAHFLYKFLKVDRLDAVIGFNQNTKKIASTIQAERFFLLDQMIQHIKISFDGYPEDHDAKIYLSKNDFDVTMMLKGKMQSGVWDGVLYRFFTSHPGEDVMVEPLTMRVAGQHIHLGQGCWRQRNKGVLCFSGEMQQNGWQTHIKAIDWQMSSIDRFLIGILGVKRAKGILDADLLVKGQGQHLHYAKGHFQLQKSSFYVPDLNIFFKSSRVELKGRGLQGTLHAMTQVDQGVATVDGAYDFIQSGHLHFDALLKEFMPINHKDLQVVLSGKLQGHFSSGSLSLKGDASVERGHFHYDHVLPVKMLPPDVHVVGTPPSLKDRLYAGLNLALHLDVNKGLQVDYRGLKGTLKGAVDLKQAPAGFLVANGSLHLEKATYDLRGSGTLDLTRSFFHYYGGIWDNPFIDVKVERAIDGTSGSFMQGPLLVGLSVKGQFKDYRIDYYSSPVVLTHEEILSYLLTGSTSMVGDVSSQMAAGNQISSVSLGARLFNLFHFSSMIQKTLKLDQFGIEELKYDDPSTMDALASNSLDHASTSTTSIVVGKRIGSRLFLRYHQSLTDPYYLLEMTYRLTQRFLFRAYMNPDSQSILFLFLGDY
jgi:hypothetical protein